MSVIGKPAVCVSNCRTVTFSDFGLANDGRYFAAVSSSDRRPSSIRICTAAPTIGFVIDRMQAIVSGLSGVPSSRSESPNVSCRTVRRFLITSSSAPTASPCSIQERRRVFISSSAAGETPTSTADAGGNEAGAWSDAAKAAALPIRLARTSATRFVVVMSVLRLPP